MLRLRENGWDAADMSYGPTARYGHTAVKDGDTLVVFGGKHIHDKFDTWRLNVSKVRRGQHSHRARGVPQIW